MPTLLNHIGYVVNCQTKVVIGNIKHDIIKNKQRYLRMLRLLSKDLLLVRYVFIKCHLTSGCGYVSL